MKKWLVAAVALHAALLLLMRAGVEPTVMHPVRFSEPKARDAEVELELETSIVPFSRQRGSTEPAA